MITAKTVVNWLADPAGLAAGFDYRPDRSSIEVVADPQVDGTFAAQFTDTTDGDVVHLLFVTACEEGSDADVLAASLESVDFPTWPPVSGALRFFA